MDQKGAKPGRRGKWFSYAFQGRQRMDENGLFEQGNSPFVGQVFWGLTCRDKRVGLPHWVECGCQPQGTAFARTIGNLIVSDEFERIQGFSILTGEVWELLWGSVLCMVGCRSASPASTHLITVPTPCLNCDNPKHLQTLPNIPLYTRGKIIPGQEPLKSTSKVEKRGLDQTS